MSIESPNTFSSSDEDNGDDMKRTVSDIVQSKKEFKQQPLSRKGLSFRLSPAARIPT